MAQQYSMTETQEGESTLQPRHFKDLALVNHDTGSKIATELTDNYIVRSIKAGKVIGHELNVRFPRFNFVYFGHDDETNEVDVADCFSFADLSCNYIHDEVPATAILTFKVKDVVQGFEKIANQDICGLSRSNSLREAWSPAKEINQDVYDGRLLEFTPWNLPCSGRFADEPYHGNVLMPDPVPYGEFDCNRHYSVLLSYYIEEVDWGWTW